MVLDTNAVLDWLVFADPRIAALAAAIKGRRIDWFATAGMRAEFAGVLARPQIARHASRHERALTVFDGLAQIRAKPASAQVGLSCADADDRLFVDLAVAERARWLITRDHALLALRERASAQGLAIAVPEAWRAA